MSAIKLDGLTLASTANSAVNLDSSVNIKPLLNASGSAPVYACRAWVNFDGTATFSPNPGTNAIRDSGNVSSCQDNGTGDYTVNFATAMPDANYAVATSYNLHQAISGNNSSLQVSNATYTASAVRVKAWYGSGGGTTDTSICNVAIFR